MSHRTFKFPAALAGLALMAACGGDGLPTGVNSGDQPTVQEVDVLVQALFGDFSDLGNFAMSRQPNIVLPAGLNLSVAGVPINETVNESTGCGGGGTVTVTGSVKGDVNQETGVGNAEFNLTERIRSCVVSGESITFTVSSDPDIRLTGDLDVKQSSFSMSFRVGGGLAFTTDDDRSGTCNVSISVNLTFSQSGETVSAEGSVSGSVCGRSINAI